MKLLHVIGSMDPMSGGPCQGIRNTTLELEKLGVFREIASLDKPDATFLGMDNFPIHTFGPSISPWRYVPDLLPWLIDNLSRFDVVILNGLWLYPGYALYKAMKILRRKVRKAGGDMGELPKFFIMSHGMLDPYFQRAPDRKLKAIRNWFYWKLIEGRLLNSADGVLFTCEAELKLARESFTPYHPKKELNVGYGVQRPPLFTEGMASAFLDRCPDLQNGKFFLFLSRIHEKKGVDLLIEAYNSILQDKSLVSDLIPKLVIAGPGLDTAYGKKIKKLVNDFKIGEHVIFPGMLSGDAKWGAFYGCEAFVLPSHQENFGIAVAEALACGKPVLISNQVNIWREIEYGGGGIIGDDSLEGTQLVLRSWLKKSASEKEEMQKGAYNTYKDNFGIISVTKKLFETLTNE
ncbi:glycosyltransferase involved in cell wall biosynthesis [Mucilaginibacter gracilis]|uniref:Glycosyltransferase involved in cell wall biosynthesis n=1 Tax=Mucilaginibacter gracilis TaxID=423350 RepID=A0A495J0X1_9SPHI|nr:glycosyltransferase [Mucilaginibacter gracilis]RKR82261.1 glycosyltransferase involved in cell wall biosynthesis [Mucilaginibacter gracilis]